MSHGIIQEFSHLSGSNFENFFTTAQQDWYDLMCLVDIHDKMNPTCSHYVNILGRRTPTDRLKIICAEVSF